MQVKTSSTSRPYGYPVWTPFVAMRGRRCARARSIRAIDALLAANEMPLQFNKDIFASERLDQQPDAIRRVLRAAQVPHSKERHQSLGEPRQLVPAHRAMSFLAAQMRLRQQFTQVFVTGAIFH